MGSLLIAVGERLDRHKKVNAYRMTIKNLSYTTFSISANGVIEVTKWRQQEAT